MGGDVYVIMMALKNIQLYIVLKWLCNIQKAFETNILESESYGEMVNVTKTTDLGQ